MTSKVPSAGSPSFPAKALAQGRKAGARLSDFLVNAVLQVRTYKKLYPGLMHALIFWGVTLQVLGTAINLMQMQLFIPFIELPFPRGQVYFAFELAMDLAGVAILLGVLMAFVRRLVWRPKSLETRWDDLAALTLLGLIPLAGFTLEGLRLAASAPEWAGWSPVGSLATRLMRSLGVSAEAAAAWHPVFFWGHAALGLALVASIPFTKMRHLVTTPLHVIFHSPRKAGELEKIENIEEAEQLGVGKIAEFAPRQLLSFDACVRCGRCEDTCPAAASGMAFSPRAFIQSLHTAMNAALIGSNGKADQALLGQAVAEQSIWFCTTCGACLAGCPAFVNPVDEIVDLRRYQALTTGKLPKPVADTFRHLEREGNPWGMPPAERVAWKEGLDVRELAPGESTDCLLFMGCAAAFDERNRKVARAFARLLQKAGLDFAILGLDETCCGETARRLGHEYLFQEFARQNIETLSKVTFNRIITQCPHCYNTLKKEYSQLGGHFRIQHATEILAKLALPWPGVPTNGSRPVEPPLGIAYHDSCYLGRYNQLYRQPRQALQQAGLTPIEFEKHGAGSFCCGGGGGQMWMETDPSTRINQRRLAQAVETKAVILATACPYCLLMFDDAIRSQGLSDRLQVFDIAELVEKQLTHGRRQ